MANYKRLILAENETGAPVLAICPTSECVCKGDLVSINGGNLVVAQMEQYVDVYATEYAMYSAITVIYEVEAIYRLKYEKEEKKDA